MTGIEIRSVSKRYADVLALDQVNVASTPGEFLVLFGRPGAGKSTFLRVTAGVDDASSGEILFNGHSVANQPPQRRNVAMAFESYALYPHWPVGENLEFPLRAPGRSVAVDERRRKIAEVAALLEIDHLLARRPSQLSGGQRQRVSLGRALVRSGTGVAVSLLDEPIAHLDARLRHWLRGELRHYQQRYETTTFYATPDYVEAFGIADRVVVLLDGRVRQVGTPLDIQSAPADTDVAAMLGDPKMNLIPLDEDGPARRTALMHGAPDTAVVAGVWPTDLSVAEAEGDLPGTVYVVEPLGYEQIVRVDVPGCRVQLKVPSGATFRPGEDVSVKLRWDAVHYFGADGRRLSESRS